MPSPFPTPKSRIPSRIRLGSVTVQWSEDDYAEIPEVPTVPADPNADPPVAAVPAVPATPAHTDPSYNYSYMIEVRDADMEVMASMRGAYDTLTTADKNHLKRIVDIMIADAQASLP